MGRERRFEWRGSKPTGLFGYSPSSARTVFLTEGETDCMRLWQALTDSEAEDFAVFGIPGVNGWHTAYASLEPITNAERVYVLLDEEPDYTKQSYVDKCWKQLRTDLGRRAKRIQLPQDPTPVKDVCEFFDHYELETLRLLADAPSNTGRFKPLNLHLPAPPIEWFVQDLIAVGDLGVIQGDPGLGKSWLCMDLAVAVAEGRSEWLGLPLYKGGRVLYIDEENAESLIRNRLGRLGLKSGDAAVDNIRYLQRQQVRLDKNPDELIEEALEFDPVLIILDSLTRLHTQDENNAGAISQIFNEGILPLSRDVGSTVLLIHHVNKSDSGSGFKRSRGSGDIVANPDAGFDCRASGQPDTFILHQYKNRRGKEHDDIRLKIEDTEGGGIRLAVRELPF